MAKLHSYYGLCPIIDQISLLGISEDQEPDHAIVTLDKNICIKYRICDQKQLQSWRTKDKYSSAVVYDHHSEKYVAAFNQSYLRMWDKDEEGQVDKLKKFKFNIPIHKLISHLSKTFVIFTNGLIYELNKALELRKEISEDGILTSDDYIFDYFYTSAESNIYFGLIIANGDNKKFYWVKIDEQFVNSKYFHFELKYLNCDLIGYMLNKPNEDKNVNLFTLWSNGKLLSCPLNNVTNPPGSPFATINTLSTEFFITMLPLDQDYIAMYGADKNDEGATLEIYNVQFKVVQSRQTFKMFKNHAKIWQVDNNLLMCVGQNLAVVPFQLEAEQFALLVGSHKLQSTEKDSDVTIMQELLVDNWNTKSVFPYSRHKLPTNLEQEILELSQQGYAEVIICNVLIPRLLENGDVKGIKHCLRYFTNIPEICMAKILKFALSDTNDKKHFKILSREKDAPIKPFEKRKFVNMILDKPFNELHLMPHLRNEFDVDDVTTLLKYIMYIMADIEEKLSMEYEKRLVEWACILLDTNYQRFLLGKSDKIVDVLVEFQKFVTDYLKQLERVDRFMLNVNLKMKAHSHSKSNNMKHSENRHTVEDIDLF